jgi:lipoprotein NlpD
MQPVREVAAIRGPAGSLAAVANAGQHLVRKGDTLYSVALEHGRNPRDLAQWNQISDPAALRVGQSLTLAPPADAAQGAVASDSGVQVSPVTSVGRLDTQLLGAGVAVQASPVVAKAETLQTESAKSTVDINWAWPVPGKVLETYDAARNKGIDVSGLVGEAVHAASDGKVVYSGNGLRGYGNLVIVKHSETFLSAYAHNSKLLVNQGDIVKRGQKIAELGSSDADKPKLHFEIRREGQPVDPLKYLPTR